MSYLKENFKTWLKILIIILIPVAVFAIWFASFSKITLVIILASILLYFLLIGSVSMVLDITKGNNKW